MAAPKPWDRYLDDRRAANTAELNDADQAYYDRRDKEAAAARARLWVETPAGFCGDCLHPIPAEWSTCLSCDAAFDREQREANR